MSEQNITFIENPVTQNTSDKYKEINVDSACVLKSWRSSLFSFEWLDTNGQIKPIENLPENEQSKRRAVEDKIKKKEPIEKAVLGIGIADNIEIGSGRAEFLTLAALGVQTIPVHIPKSSEKDFKAFLVDIDSQES